MAGPKVFVSGPSVNPNLIGSPTAFLKNIGNITSSRRADRRQREQLAQNKIFQEGTQALNLRKQDFAEAEPDRAKAEALYLREQANLRAQEQLSAVDQSGFSRVDTFLKNPEAQAFLESQGITDPAAQREAVMNFAQSGNKQLFSDPTVQAQSAYENIIQNKGSLAEAEAAKATVLGQYPTLPVPLAEKLLSTGSNTAINKIFGSGSTSTAGKPVQSAPNQQAEEELRDTLTGRMGIEDARGGGLVDTVANLFGVGDPTRSSWDFGNRDLDQGDVDRLIGTWGDRYPQHAIVGAMRSVVNPDDGIINQEKWQDILNRPDSTNAKAFKTEIENWQAKAERTRGGKILSGMSAKDMFALAGDLQKSQDARNMDIISRTSPQGATFDDRLAAFQGSFPTDTPRQGGNGSPGGPILSGAPETAPVVAPAAGGTGSAGLDALLDPDAGAVERSAPPVAATGSAAVDQLLNAPSASDTTQYQVGGGEILPERILSGVKDVSFAPYNAAKKIFESVDLTLPAGTGVLGSGTGRNKGGQTPQVQARVKEIQKELKAIPASGKRTLLQAKRARELRAELQDIR